MSALTVPGGIGAQSNIVGFDIQRFELSQTIASVIANASVLPEHLRTDPKTKRELPAEAIRANCVLIVNQALRWGVDPFSIAPETYVIAGKLGYTGKLVLAVVNALAGLEQNLRFLYDGQGESLTCTAFGTIAGEAEDRRVTVRLSDAKVGNGYRNDMYKKDPEQKLVYDAAIKWARRHCPGVLMGIFTDSPMDMEPEPQSFDNASTIDSTAVEAKRLAAPKTAGPLSGDDLVASYEARIDGCQTKDELSRLVDKIKSEPPQLLPEMDRALLTDRARRIWKSLPESVEDSQEDGEQEASTEAPAQGAPEDSAVDDAAQEGIFRDYEAAILTAEELQFVAELSDRLDRDERLSIQRRKELSRIVNERSAALRKASR